MTGSDGISLMLLPRLQVYLTTSRMISHLLSLTPLCRSYEMVFQLQNSSLLGVLVRGALSPRTFLCYAWSG